MCKPAVNTEPLELQPRPSKGSQAKQARYRTEQAALATHKQLLGELYHVLDALGAPRNVMDQVASAIQGKPLPYKTLLPFAIPSDTDHHPASTSETVESIINDEELEFLEHELFDSKSD